MEYMLQEQAITRCVIMPIYDAHGIVDRYIYSLIEELYTVSEYIIVVSNGKLNQVDYLQLGNTVDKLIIRENCGYDAGAYKDVLLNHISEQELAEFDEIIFCNDTFFGPFIPLKKIFATMAEKQVDFWAMTYIDAGLFSYLSSYFMVFKQEIIKSNQLSCFFKNILDNDIDTWLKTCINFEIGIYQYLSKQFSYAAYITKPVYRLYTNPDLAIAQDLIPLIKKKSFSDDFYQHEIILNALQLIKNNSSYDLNCILDSIKRKYNIQITINDICQHKQNLYLNNRQVIGDSLLTIGDINNFIAHFDNLYIYGLGYYANFIINILGQLPDQFKGFIVSTSKKKHQYYMNYPVYEIDELESSTKTGIIIALNPANTQVVLENIHDKFLCLLLWK